KGGDRVIEPQLIEALGIGRTPVRQAIQRLASDGLLDANPGTFAIVHSFTEKERQDYGMVRLAIDTVAAPLVILNGSNRDFQNLLDTTIACQKASEQNDIPERIRLDFAFHNLFVALSGNHELTKIQEQITRRGRLMQLQIYRRQGASFCDLSGHLDIIRALHDRDTSSCILAVKAHLGHSYASDSDVTPEWKAVESALNLTVS
ncbi:MAG: GntR family transcriptional regulator, partial [Clostridiales bacterium]|nr:GntR family transcriptional regulator [Clostridiales bacterium]